MSVRTGPTVPVALREQDTSRGARVQVLASKVVPLENTDPGGWALRAPACEGPPGHCGRPAGARPARSSVRGAAQPDRITPNEIPTGPHSSAAPAPSTGPPGSAASWASPPSAHPQLSQAAPFPANGGKPQLTSRNGTGTTTVLPSDRWETAADERTDRPPAPPRPPSQTQRTAVGQENTYWGRLTPIGAGY